MKRFRNVICLILGILSPYSLLVEVTSEGIKFSRSNTMMLTYLILAIFLFFFYKFRPKLMFLPVAGHFMAK